MKSVDYKDNIEGGLSSGSGSARGSGSGSYYGHGDGSGYGFGSGLDDCDGNG